MDLAAPSPFRGMTLRRVAERGVQYLRRDFYGQNQPCRAARPQGLGCAGHILLWLIYYPSMDELAINDFHRLTLLGAWVVINIAGNNLTSFAPFAILEVGLYTKDLI